MSSLGFTIKKRSIDLFDRKHIVTSAIVFQLFIIKTFLFDKALAAIMAFVEWAYSFATVLLDMFASRPRVTVQVLNADGWIGDLEQ